MTRPFYNHIKVIRAVFLSTVALSLQCYNAGALTSEQAMVITDKSLLKVCKNRTIACFEKCCVCGEKGWTQVSASRQGEKGVVCEYITTRGSSLIENLSFNYIHNALDWQVNQGSMNCSPCGADEQNPNTVPTAELERIHRFRDITEHSSFGPGVFTSYDIKLTLWVEGPGNRIRYFDPNLFFAINYDDGVNGGADVLDGIYYEDLRRLEKGRVTNKLELYDNQGELTTSLASAQSAEIIAHSGNRLIFEIVEMGPGEWAGRPVAIRNRNNYGITLSYKSWTPAEIAASPERQFQIDTISDDNGRQLSFSYHPVQVSGQWVVSEVALPNGESITYDYSDGFLSQVNYPDGTLSSFTYTYEPTSNTTAVSFQDAAAESAHRNKTAYLTNNFSAIDDPGYDFIDFYNTASLLVRIVANAEEEVTYMNLFHPTSPYVSWIYEGGNKLKLDYFTTALVYYQDGWSIDSNGQVNGAYETSYTENDWGGSAKNYYQGTPTEITNEDGVTISYEYDDRHFVTKKTYSDSTTNTWELNEFKQITRFKDRLNRVTRYTYDARGNLLTREEGILEIGGSDVNQPEYAVYAKEYYPEGHANEFLLRYEWDANGNRKEFIYDANHFLVEIIEPDDTGSGFHTASTFAYDSAGRLSSTTDALGRITQFDYDERDRQVKTTYSDASTELKIYGTGIDANLVIKSKDRNGNTTRFEYDAAGRVTTQTVAYSVMNADGSAEILNPAEVQRVVQTTDYLSGTNLPLSRIDDGERTDYTYDYRNRLVKTTVYPNTGIALESTRTYVDNLLFSTEDPYGRKTYHAYRDSDRARVTTVRGTKPSFSLADFAAVENLPVDLNVNAAYLITDYNLDAEAQIIETIDPRAISHTKAYDSRGRVISQTEAAGTPVAATSTIEYDSNSNVVAVTNPRGFQTEMTYGRRNLPDSRTEAAGTADEATEFFTYYLDGLKATHTDFNSNTTTFTWGTCCKRFQASIDPSGAATITRHNDSGDLTHQATVSAYDSNIFPTLSDPENVTNIPDNATINETTTRFDSRHRPIATTVWLSPRGYVDANNPPIAGDPGYPATDGLTTTYFYDDDLTDGIGLDATYAAHLPGLNLGSGSDGRAVAVTNPENETSVTIYDGLGRVVRTIDALGHANTMTYDQVVAIAGFGAVVETSASDALNHVNKQRADGAGRRLESEEAEQNITTYSYDTNSNLVSYRDPNGVGQDCIFDARNRDVSCTDTQGDTTTRQYDANNNVIVQTDALSQNTTCVFDARDRKVSCTDRIGATTTYVYDANNNLLSITDAEGGTTTYTYDARNLLSIEIFPHGDAGTTRKAYSYDSARRLTSRLVNTIENPSQNETTNYVYDRANRLLERQYPNEINGDDLFTYDAASRLLVAESQRYNNTVTRAYDADSKIISETLSIDGASYVIDYTYDAADRQISITYPNGKQVTRTYTDRNQLEDIFYNGVILASSVYDMGMREINRSYANGVSTVKTYQNDNLISSIEASNGLQGILSLSYTYDANKRKLTETDTLRSAASQIFNYDFEDRLTNWKTDNTTTNQDWNLSDVGDWISTVRTGADPINENRNHSDVHEVTVINGNALTYDFKGNLATNPQNSQTYLWDAENHLKTIGNSVDADYRYDALGRRVQKAVTENAITTTTTFVCAGAQVVTEYENNTEKQSYVYHSYVDDPIALIKVDGTTNYYHQNHLFSVEVITDNSGNLVETYDYDSHGKMTIKDGLGADMSESIVGNAYGFTGRRLDVESGLYDFRARYFDVELGRFVSRDPLRYIDGMGVYGAYFVPIHLDPYGLCGITVDYDPKDVEGMKYKFGLPELEKDEETDTLGAAASSYSIVCKCIKCPDDGSSIQTDCKKCIVCEIKWSDTIWVDYFNALDTLYVNFRLYGDIEGNPVDDQGARDLAWAEVLPGISGTYGHEQAHILALRSAVNKYVQSQQGRTVCKDTLWDNCEVDAESLEEDLDVKFKEYIKKDADHELEGSPKRGTGVPPHGGVPPPIGPFNDEYK